METKPEICKITISFQQLNGDNSCQVTDTVPLSVAQEFCQILINWEKEFDMQTAFAREYFKEEARLLKKD